MENRKSDVLLYQNEVFNQLHYANTLVKMTKTSCMDREFNKQYYGINNENSVKLSDERNEYIAMMDLISDKLSDILNINLCIEKELCLQKNSNNRS